MLATAEHESVLLPTIVSRAIVVRFAPLSEGEMNEYLEQNFPPLNADEKKLIIDFSAGNPKLLEQVLHIKKDVPECYASRLQLTHMMEQQ